jgi:hypothetical protein
MVYLSNNIVNIIVIIININVSMKTHNHVQEIKMWIKSSDCSIQLSNEDFHHYSVTHKSHGKIIFEERKVLFMKPKFNSVV